MESSFSSVTCCSGALSFFRRAAVEPYIHIWANDKFLRKEFKFATDRMLTAYILGAKQINNNSNHYWKVKYSESVRVYVKEPESFKGLIRQRIRWNKSFIRSIFATGLIYWRRPFPAALIYYTTLSLKIVRPYILIHIVFLIPLTGNYFVALLYLLGIVFTAMVYSIDFRLRNPDNPWWIYRVLMQLLTTFVFTWLLIYAAITIKKMSWR